MTNHTDDTELFAAIRRMWEDRDPMPADLIDNVLVAIETRDLADDYALLLLVSDTHELAGARGPAGSRVLEFELGATTVMLRVSELDDGRVRLDGWLAPAVPGTIVLDTDSSTMDAQVSGEGRFEFAIVDRGAAHLRFESAESSGFTTEQFEL